MENTGSDNRIGALLRLYPLQFSYGTEETVSYFSFPSLSLPFSGYITVVDFIHFFQMKKNLLLALVGSGIHLLTMGPFVLV